MESERGRYTGPLVDCDVHNALPSRRRASAVHAGRVALAPRRADVPADGVPRGAREPRRPLVHRCRVPAPDPARLARRRVAAGRRRRRRPTSPSRRRSCSTRGTSRRRSSTRCSGSARCSTSSSPAVMARAANDWLADRVARPRPAPARLDRRPLRGPPGGGRRDRPARQATRGSCRCCAVAHDRADRAAPVLADLRGVRAARACRSASTTAAGAATRSRPPASRRTTSRTPPRWPARSRHRSAA